MPEKADHGTTPRRDREETEKEEGKLAKPKRLRAEGGQRDKKRERKNQRREKMQSKQTARSRGSQCQRLSIAQQQSGRATHDSKAERESANAMPPQHQGAEQEERVAGGRRSPEHQQRSCQAGVIHISGKRAIKIRDQESNVTGWSQDSKAERVSNGLSECLWKCLLQSR